MDDVHQYNEAMENSAGHSQLTDTVKEDVAQYYADAIEHYKKKPAESSSSGKND